MKQIILIGILLIGLTTMNNTVYGQTYTTESKSCGSCGKAVSINSSVGMRCPHCGVRWGYENETKSTTPSYNYDNYNNKTSGFTNSNANLRSQPSKNASILTVVPSYTSVSIIERVGDWYYVKYSYHDNNFSSRTLKGYIHKSLIN